MPLPHPHFFFHCSSDRPEANYVAKDKLELLFSIPECWDPSVSTTPRFCSAGD